MRDEMEERTRNEELSTFEITKGGVTCSVEILVDRPYDMSEWAQEVEEIVHGAVDLDEFDEDDVLARGSIDQVSYVHPDTNEFDVVYEARWEFAEGVGPEAVTGDDVVEKVNKASL